MDNSNKDQEMVDASIIEQSQPGVGRSIWQQIQLVMRLLRDPKVPIPLKLLPFAAVAYIIMPVDFIPDVIPALGQLDDLGLFLVGMKMFIDMAPVDVVTRHLQAIRQGDGYTAYSFENDAAGDAGDQDEPLIIDGEVIIEKSPEDIE